MYQNTSVPGLAKQWRQFQRLFVDLLRELKTTPPTKESEFHMFNDPFLQCLGSDRKDIRRPRHASPGDYHKPRLSHKYWPLNSSSSIRNNSTGRKEPSIEDTGYQPNWTTPGISRSSCELLCLSAFSRLLHSDNDMIKRSSSDSAAM